MTAFIFRSSQPNNWVMSKRHLDENQRRMIYGPIQPMVQKGLFERLMGRRLGLKNRS